MEHKTRKEQVEDVILRESSMMANRAVGVTNAHMAAGLAINLIIERLGYGIYAYPPICVFRLVTAILIYLVPMVIAAAGRYKRTWHRTMLLTSLIVGGYFAYIGINMFGRLFVLVPLVLMGAYASISVCRSVLVGTCIATSIGNLVCNWTDINLTHQMGYSWAFRDVMINHFLPMGLFISVLYFTTVYLTRGRIRSAEKMIEITATGERRDTELETAITIQSEVFKHPYDLNDYGDIDIAGGIIAAHDVAGDFFDYFITEKGKLVLVVGDVLDKGLPAAMFMIGARNSIRSLFSVLDDLGEIMGKANRICSETSAEAIVSMFVAEFDPKTGHGEYVNAGHPAPVILHANGTAGRIETEPQMMIGAFCDSTYVAKPIYLDKGDVLYLYTDGISEAVDINGDEYDISRLASITRKLPEQTCAKDIVHAIRSDVDDFSNTDRRASDDRTLLITRWGNNTPNIKGGTWHMDLGADNDANDAGGMEVLNATLEHAGVPDDMRRTLDCAIDDLLSNVIDYSGASSIRMSVHATDAFCRVTITDDGTPFDPYRYANPQRDLLSDGGRGIALVRAMMDETAYCYENGKNINTVTKYR